MSISPKNSTRRDVLAWMAMLAGGGLLGRELFSAPAAATPSGYHPILSVQIFIWIQHFQSEKKTLAEGVEEALHAIHRAGYKRVELFADFFGEGLRARTLALLKENELDVPTVYASSTLHEPGAAEKSVAQIADLAKELKPAGLRGIVTNPSPKPNHGRKSDEELDTQVRYLNRLGADLQKNGVILMVHHHTPELLDRAREWRYQLRHTDPNLVRCCVDVQWAHRGGQEPLAFLREVENRLSSLHVRNTKGGVWMEDFAEGDIDYHQIADYLRQINYRGYLVVELAYEKGTTITRPLEDDLRLSRLYTEKVFSLHES